MIVAVLIHYTPFLDEQQDNTKRHRHVSVFIEVWVQSQGTPLAYPEAIIGDVTEEAVSVWEEAWIYRSVTEWAWVVKC